MSEPNQNPLVSLEKKVLSIDHIREPIFEGLSRRTLFNCRLVSSRWAYFGSKALQKITDIQLVQPFAIYPAVILPIYRHIFDPELSLDALETLMNSSSEFPCTSFCFTHLRRNKGDPRAETFLEAHGKQITKLEFGGVLYLIDVKRLLLDQAPNLEQLLLNKLTYVITESDNFCTNSDSASATIQKRVNRRNSLYDETAIIGPKPFLKNLKIFKSNSDLLPKVFMHQIMECTPNLSEVLLHAKYFYCLLQPVNRLHLLQKLEINITHDNITAFEMIANGHEGHLALQEINVLGYGIIELYQNVYIKAVDIVYKILRGSAATCQKLTWRETRKHFQVPQMLQVKHLSFVSWGIHSLCFPLHVFQSGASLRDMFPNLKSLTMGSMRYIEGKGFTLATFFGVDDPVPVQSVTDVYLNCCNTEPNLVQGFREMFPNACIHTNSEGGWNDSSM